MTDNEPFLDHRPWWWVGGPMFPGSQILLSARQVDELFDRPAVAPLRDPAKPDPTEPGAYDSYGFPETDGAGSVTTWASWITSCIHRARPTPQPYRVWSKGAFAELAGRLDATAT